MIPRYGLRATGERSKTQTGASESVNQRSVNQMKSVAQYPFLIH